MSAGPLRIIRQPAAYGATNPAKEYWDKLARLAPTEVTAFYLALRPMVMANLKPDEVAKDTLAPWWPWIGLGLVLFVRWWGTRGEKWWKPQWGAIAIAMAAFLLWTITMGHYVAYLSEWAFIKDARVVGVIAGLFTFVVPYYYKPDAPPAPLPAPPAPPPVPPGATP